MADNWKRTRLGCNLAVLPTEAAGAAMGDQIPRAFANGEDTPKGMVDGKIAYGPGWIFDQEGGQDVAAVRTGAGRQRRRAG